MEVPDGPAPYIGEEADEKKSELGITYPVKNSVITDFDSMEEVRQTMMKTTSHCVCLLRNRDILNILLQIWRYIFGYFIIDLALHFWYQVTTERRSVSKVRQEVVELSPLVEPSVSGV